MISLLSKKYMEKKAIFGLRKVSEDFLLNTHTAHHGNTLQTKTHFNVFLSASMCYFQ